jgi:hypothetical protein
LPGEGRINKCSPGDFEGSEAILYDTIMINAYIVIHLLKHMEGTTQWTVM